MKILPSSWKYFLFHENITFFMKILPSSWKYYPFHKNITFVLGNIVYSMFLKKLSLSTYNPFSRSPGWRETSGTATARATAARCLAPSSGSSIHDWSIEKKIRAAKDTRSSEAEGQHDVFIEWHQTGLGRQGPFFLRSFSFLCTLIFFYICKNWFRMDNWRVIFCWDGISGNLRSRIFINMK